MSKMKVIIATFISVLALGALASSSASAETAGWLVGGTLLTGTQTAALATTAAVDQEGVLKFSTRCGANAKGKHLAARHQKLKPPQ